MKSKAELLQLAMKSLRPTPKVPVSQWADENRVLSIGASAEPGRWKTSRIPYAREIMDAFTEPGVHRVVVKSAAQIGKTEIILNVIGRYAHLDPCTILMIQPTLEMATDVSKSRIAPMIRDTRILSELFSDAKTRDTNQTLLSKFFPGGRLVLGGSNSPAGLASRPVRIVLFDETDRYPRSAGAEGDPILIASKRTTTFWNYVIGMFSTPTIEGASRIDVEYQTGTQEEWQHRCPNCGEFHALKWRDMLCDVEEYQNDYGHKSVRVKSVRWRCKDCGFTFDELAMKHSAQKYVSRNVEAQGQGIRSFWVNGFSSPWLSWNDIMREWYEAKGLPEAEAVIYNTRFGESYKQTETVVDMAEFIKRREPYNAQLPLGVKILTAAVDVQDNRLEFEICGWGTNEECWGIVKGEITGSPSVPQTWQLLDHVLDKEYHREDRAVLTVFRTFIDSGGHFTTFVYDYCRANIHKGRFAIKGQGGGGLRLLHKTVSTKRGIPLTMLGVDEGKQLVMNRLSQKEVGSYYFHFPTDDMMCGYNRGYDEAYFTGLTSERREVSWSGGILHTVWRPISRSVRNEPLDLRVYNLAAIQSCKIDWTKFSDATVKREVKEVKKNTIQTKAMNIW